MICKKKGRGDLTVWKLEMPDLPAWKGLECGSSRAVKSDSLESGSEGVGGGYE
jgi:hypothetical protein